MKGLWFVSATGWLLKEHGPETLDRVASRMGEHGPLLADAIASAWYSEEALQAALMALRNEFAEGDDERYVAVLRAMVGDGIGRFFRLMLQLGSADFVLRKIPILWTRVQRGPGKVEVETLQGSAVVRYRRFPYFGDRNYVLMTRASLEAMVEASIGRLPAVHVVGQGDDWLDIEVVHGRS